MSPRPWQTDDVEASSLTNEDNAASAFVLEELTRLLSSCHTKESAVRHSYAKQDALFLLSLPDELIVSTFFADKKDNYLLDHPEISIKNFKYIHTFM